MAASTIRSKKKAAKPTKSFEESLWDTATKLRGSVESSEWSGATEPEWSGDSRRQTTRQGSPQGERGGAHQHGVAGFDFVHLCFAPVVLASSGEPSRTNGSMSTNITGDCPARSAMKTPKAKPQSLTRQREKIIKAFRNAGKADLPELLSFTEIAA